MVVWSKNPCSEAIFEIVSLLDGVVLSHCGSLPNSQTMPRVPSITLAGLAYISREQVVGWTVDARRKLLSGDGGVYHLPWALPSEQAALQNELSATSFNLSTGCGKRMRLVGFWTGIYGKYWIDKHRNGCNHRTCVGSSAPFSAPAQNRVP